MNRGNVSRAPGVWRRISRPGNAVKVSALILSGVLTSGCIGNENESTAVPGSEFCDENSANYPECLTTEPSRTTSRAPRTSTSPRTTTSAPTTTETTTTTTTTETTTSSAEATTSTPTTTTPVRTPTAPSPPPAPAEPEQPSGAHPDLPGNGPYQCDIYGNVSSSTLEGKYGPYCDQQTIVTAAGDESVIPDCRVYGETVYDNEGRSSDIWVIWHKAGSNVLAHSSELLLPTGPLAPCSGNMNYSGAQPVD